MPLLEPLTQAQSEFYEINRLHQKGKSHELVSKARSFLGSTPPKELARPVMYYAAFHQSRLGNLEEARHYYREILRLYPGSGWDQLALSNLSGLKES